MAVIGGYILNSILFMCQTDVDTSAGKPDGGDAAVHCGVRRVQRWLSLQHLRGGQLFLLVLMNKVSVFMMVENSKEKSGIVNANHKS